MRRSTAFLWYCVAAKGSFALCVQRHTSQTHATTNTQHNPCCSPIYFVRGAPHIQRHTLATFVGLRLICRLIVKWPPPRTACQLPSHVLCCVSTFSDCVSLSGRCCVVATTYDTRESRTVVYFSEWLFICLCASAGEETLLISGPHFCCAVSSSDAYNLMHIFLRLYCAKRFPRTSTAARSPKNESAVQMKLHSMRPHTHMRGPICRWVCYLQVCQAAAAWWCT